MIARLALVEAGVAFASTIVDIHRRVQQFEPAYARINPNMTVPSLSLPDGKLLTDSRDIVYFAFGGVERFDGATHGWVDRQYGFPIEDLTFGKLLTSKPFMGRFVSKTLAKSQARLLALANENPDLAERYRARAEKFAGRRKTFDPEAIVSGYATRLGEARGHLDALDSALSDGRSFLASTSYGPADVVWTAFIARFHFIKMGSEVDRRPALARYAKEMFARPSSKTADIWTKFHPLKMLKQVF